MKIISNLKIFLATTYKDLTQKTFESLNVSAIPHPSIPTNQDFEVSPHLRLTKAEVDESMKASSRDLTEVLRLNFIKSKETLRLTHALTRLLKKNSRLINNMIFSTKSNFFFCRITQQGLFKQKKNKKRFLTSEANHFVTYTYSVNPSSTGSFKKTDASTLSALIFQNYSLAITTTLLAVKIKRLDSRTSIMKHINKNSDILCGFGHFSTIKSFEPKKLNFDSQH
ncbi:MAG: hypothetical protein KAT46_02220 [Deltaproteobacteria bacterium]|nr:hypothetical protein [Deltaproteobacteria bacterium]